MALGCRKGSMLPRLLAVPLLLLVSFTAAAEEKRQRHSNVNTYLENDDGNRYEQRGVMFRATLN